MSWEVAISHGVTLVDRKIEGDYAVCGGGVCNITFDGAYMSKDYDPRVSLPTCRSHLF